MPGATSSTGATESVRKNLKKAKKSLKEIEKSPI
jgi:hypothetical protein